MAGTGGSFGEWLIDVELPGRGMELTEFARQLGVSTSTIYRWREHNPRSNMIGRVAQLLGYSYVELAERFGMGRKKRRDNDENDLVERVARELLAYPPEVRREIMARVEQDRRKQEDGNRKDS